ncbi:hypothetical protein FHX75_111348 [Micromonospora palomenae]|uniref:Uncharacterized protein n=1 Tax=Micromonospora palomenae TaxID=1461247 RepID=A0A561WWG0_9ACTN|nr:hypothetical protein [Micromonospora palomenae]TWG28197.1 hypothetical protein FHX75_111348 [Micromonospora palomenae]
MSGRWLVTAYHFELLARVLPDAHLHVSATAADVPTWSDRIGTFLAG